MTLNFTWGLLEMIRNWTNPKISQNCHERMWEIDENMRDLPTNPQNMAMPRRKIG